MDEFDRAGRLRPIGTRKTAQDKAPDTAASGIPLALDKHIKKLQKALGRSRNKQGKPKIVVINGSDRNENTCPGEPSKASRLCERAISHLEKNGIDVTFLNLSRMTAEKDLMIWPCKACFSTSPALCHFGCSCYPNEDLNQGPDWMRDEIYEILMETHGVFVITPTYWYSMPSCLKLLIDRMICLDGANPDPSTTLSPDGSVKNVEKAKTLERGRKKGGKSKWDYNSNKAMAGKIFSVFAHGDSEGPELVQHAVSETFLWFGMIEAQSWNDYIGYMTTYSDSHDELTKDKDTWQAVAFLSEQLAKATKEAHKNGMPIPDLLPNSLQR